MRAVSGENLSDQQAEFAIAKNGDAGVLGQVHLIEDFAGGGERFQKNGLVIGQRIRNRVEISFRQSEVFGEGAWVIHNAQHGARGTVTAKTPDAPSTLAASEIDFACDAAAEPIGIVSFYNAPHEFVPRRSFKSVVTSLQFQVCIADAGGGHLNKREAGRPRGLRHFTEMNGGMSDMKREHKKRERGSLPIMKDSHAFFYLGNGFRD